MWKDPVKKEIKGGKLHGRTFYKVPELQINPDNIYLKGNGGTGKTFFAVKKKFDLAALKVQLLLITFIAILALRKRKKKS